MQSGFWTILVDQLKKDLKEEIMDELAPEIQKASTPPPAAPHSTAIPFVFQWETESPLNTRNKQNVGRYADKYASPRSSHSNMADKKTEQAPSPATSPSTEPAPKTCEPRVLRPEQILALEFFRRQGFSLATDHTLPDLKKAFRSLALRLHPDRPGGDANKFQLLAEAYNALKTTD